LRLQKRVWLQQARLHQIISTKNRLIIVGPQGKARRAREGDLLAGKERRRKIEGVDDQAEADERKFYSRDTSSLQFLSAFAAHGRLGHSWDIGERRKAAKIFMGASARLL